MASQKISTKNAPISISLCNKISTVVCIWHPSVSEHFGYVNSHIPRLAFRLKLFGEMGSMKIVWSIKTDRLLDANVLVLICI